MEVCVFVGSVSVCMSGEWRGTYVCGTGVRRRIYVYTVYLHGSVVLGCGEEGIGGGYVVGREVWCVCECVCVVLCVC